MDDGPFLKGFTFTLDDVWLQSVFQLEPGHPELLVLPELELRDVNKDFQQGFKIAELDATNGLGEQELESVESDAASLSTALSNLSGYEEDTPADVWTLDLELGKDDSIPRLSTWEAFEKKDVPNTEKTAYLSEAGRGAFDAVLTLQAKDSSNGVLPQDVILGALYNLVLGRSSIFFQWNAGKKVFDQTLQDVPISGHSLVCHSSLVTKLVECGSKYRTLSEYASTISSSKRSCTAVVAFKGCVSGILESIERNIAIHAAQIRSLLQLQRLADRPRQLLAVLGNLVDSVDGQITDEAIITTLSDQVHQIVCSENAFGETLQEILARVSAPWLERLCTDLGLNRTQENQPPAKFESDIEEPGDDSSLSFAEGSRGGETLSGVVSSEDRALIRNTKRSLQLLRQYVPPNPLGMWQSPGFPQEILRGGLSNSILFNTARVDPNLVPIRTAMASSGLQAVDFETVAFYGVAGGNENLAWAGDNAQQDYLAILSARMSQPLESPTQDQLRLTVSSTFENVQDTTTSEISNLSATSDFSPLERLRPLIQSHATHINNTLHRHLFRRCRLRHHLDLQRQFHLFGNGDFVSRLAKALFSTDTQSAERKRGRIPTGETMGLHLGARDGQRWPPASSEIQLILMGILTETYHPDRPNHTRTSNTSELPGGLSFSVRELPEKDIEKVMDSGSIYALDFLKLQYAPPPPLDAILAACSIQAYDDIFRFLLRLLRVLHVTTKLHETFAMAKDGLSLGATDSSRPGVQFAIEAHHCISVLMSHFMDVGIAAKWDKFQSSLNTVEISLNSDKKPERAGTNNLIGLDGLRQLHEACLESIRARLFLRRKQQKLRNGIENILTIILKCTASLEKEEAADSHADSTAFKKSLTELLSLLHTAVDKPLNGAKIDGTLEEDVEAMRMLLLRLDWNGYYGEGIVDE